MEQRKIIVIGHKNPDTDSICSAIAYAALKNAKEKNRYTARRAGNINNETAFVLNYFKMQAPPLLEDVNTQVMDIDFRETKGVSDTISIKAAWQLMKENDVVTLPIVQNENKLEGIITINDIATSYMDVFDNDVLALARTPYSNIIDTLNGTLIVGNPHSRVINGKVLVAAANPDLLENYVEKDDIVIVGDRYDTQLCAIEMGASCLIVCLDAPITKTIKHLASQKECSIISTPYDTYTVARLINQSIPIKYFMRKQHLVTFQLDETVENIKDIMSKKRHRDFPITDDMGTYQGMLSRRNLLALKRKQIILVDHNERSQAVNGIEDAEIMEVIDHHRIGSLETLSPVYFRNQPVGCTATIIYQMYKEQGIAIPENIAGILCAAIISDTLMFRSPTCTPLDTETADALAQIAGLDIESFAMEMFEAGSNLNQKTPDEIFHQDLKKFNVEDVTISVAQINVMNKNQQNRIKSRMKTYLEENPEVCDSKITLFMVTNIFEESTDMLLYGEHAEELIEEVFHVTVTDHTCTLPGVVSRKKQVMPALVNIVQQLS